MTPVDNFSPSAKDEKKIKAEDFMKDGEEEYSREAEEMADDNV